jgi:hypothetical protein
MMRRNFVSKTRVRKETLDNPYRRKYAKPRVIYEGELARNFLKSNYMGKTKINSYYFLESISEVFDIPVERLLPEIELVDKKDKQKSSIHKIYGNNFKDVDIKLFFSLITSLSRIGFKKFNSTLDKRLSEIGIWGTYTRSLQKDVLEKALLKLNNTNQKINLSDFMEDACLYLFTASGLCTLLAPTGNNPIGIFAPKMIAKKIEKIVSSGYIRKFYDKYRENGMFLLFLEPPKIGLIEMKLWERRMKKLGYLNEKGLTETGKEYLKLKYRSKIREMFKEKIE